MKADGYYWVLVKQTPGLYYSKLAEPEIGYLYMGRLTFCGNEDDSASETDVTFLSERLTPP